MLDFSAPSPSESASSGSHSSSGFDSSDLLDLNLILQDDMIQDSPTETDWSQLTSMFQEPMGYTGFDNMDFGASNMVVEPSLLTKTSHYEYDFPFTFQSPPVLLAAEYGSVPRRMSVSSSEESSLDPAAELAQRVRESAGVVMAMPTMGSMSSASLSSSSSVSSAASTPPPSTPPASQATPFHATVVPSSATTSNTILMSSRPKTSHTTIERRYRTNLNARIQSLRMAVPALRVLEWNDGPKKSKGTKAKIRNEEDSTDIIDERGYVDGVKVARKCSKANVLGKAVEYIRVLKKREMRLKCEQDGLKALLSGLVGGPALLHSWEKEWKEKFGGEEKDEVDALDIDVPESDDEDNDEEEERRRKKPKIEVPSPTPDTSVPAGLPVVPEKRKRGRPRKVVPPVAPVEKLGAKLEAQSQAPQYLLATFALFSFFNNPFSLTTPASEYTHEGVILSARPHSTLSTSQSLIQAFHLLVSVLVFFSILWPWIGKIKGRVNFDFGAFRTAKKEVHFPTMTRTASLLVALEPAKRGKQGEAEQLSKALGQGRKGESFEEKGLEQRAQVRLAEICVFNPERTSLITRLLTMYRLRSRLPWFSASAGDLSTLAMLSCPVAKRHAASIWEAAKRDGGIACAYERLVLGSVDVDEAVSRLKAAGTKAEWDRYTPIGVVACTLVLERTKAHLEGIFVESVVPAGVENASESDKEEELRRITVDAARSLGGKMAELGDVFEKVWLGGGGGLEGVWVDDDQEEEEEDDEEEKGVERDIKSLIRGIMLYRKLFPSAVMGCGGEGVSILLSPPPSPSLTDHEGAGYKLRTIMGRKVFDGEEVEEARDRVVDVLVASERRGRPF
ncbi:uncharacterized protein BT62DRAFT_967677 [Guyanagaster necrorhizus]|uniref:BHLH domain-containing protein n=1 Tax=Guyanagaster necrorhizus TaxID=856835 RepID=A0A9P7VT04_9AGAR|nr:uncharacterized protein BT62DRAFT_967677 [Guyanagaster necrorhizus MCA 3950]KAG7446878.1 hypothetical protein BT62DRAFT_967677 [Guyanagaster necrorhizus MCA 3950]